MSPQSPGIRVFLALAASVALGVNSDAATVALGAAASFGVLAAESIVDTGGTSTVIGDVGLSSGSSIGVLPVNVTGTLYLDNPVPNQARTDAMSVYTTLVGLDPTSPVVPLAGTLAPGVYFFEDTALLTGDLTLDGAGQYVFQIGSGLTTMGDASIILANGAAANDIFWLVGSSATLGAGAEFSGTLIAIASITVGTGTSIDGRLLAMDGSVTLANNTIVIPEPTTAALGLLATLVFCSRRRR